MEIETLVAIAKLAEDKRVRIELLPTGFCITAKAPVKGKGVVQVKKMISYTYAENLSPLALKDVFELIIGDAIAELKKAASRNTPATNPTRTE